MPTEPAPASPGWDNVPVRRVSGPDDFPEDGAGGWRLMPSRADWPDDAGYLAALADEEELPDPDLWEDPDNAPPPGLDDAQLAALIAEAKQITDDHSHAAALAARLGTTGALAAAGATAMGRRGPGMPGSADRFGSEYTGPAAGFGTGRELDVAPGCAVLALFAEEAAGDDDRYVGASDDELLGLICAWDRTETHMAARKHAAIAELIRRRPAPGCTPEGTAQMPETWEEFTPAELAPALAVRRQAAEDLLGLAADLEAKLPGTRAAFRAGILSAYKAGIISWATQLLDPEEARVAEALVLGRAGPLTPAGLRAAIARAVMEVAPDKARKRREAEARRARVERWAEYSGNAALAGRELPSAEVLAADQRVTWWAGQLKKAGLEGSMDELRARAYLDLLLGTDSRPGQEDAADGSPDNPGVGGLRGPGGSPPGGGPLGGAVPPGFAGRVNLTIPLATLLGLADRPGEIPGIGPIDPALARDLAAAAARNPRSTWCLTVTDQHGHAIGHGCARPAPPNPRADRAKRRKPDSPYGPDPPGGPGSPRHPGGATGAGAPGPPRFTFAAAGQPGPTGGYGTWRLSAGIPAQRDLVIGVGPITTEPCDHRYQARGHDPGVLLRHLTQVRHATCTGPGCRRPAARCDFEHDIPYQAGGRTCLCNADPKCRYDHRLKQDPRWAVDLLPGGNVRWTTPSGRQYTTEPTRYPI